jgi:hypothetical protein
MKWIAAVLTSLIYVAGYLHGIQYSVHAAALGIFCVTVLGVLFNRLQEGPLLQVIESANAYPLELGALTDQLGANGLMPLYILTDAGYQPVLTSFICRLDNQRAIVLGVD